MVLARPDDRQENLSSASNRCERTAPPVLSGGAQEPDAVRRLVTAFLYGRRSRGTGKPAVATAGRYRCAYRCGESACVSPARSGSSGTLEVQLSSRAFGALCAASAEDAAGSHCD